MSRKDQHRGVQNTRSRTTRFDTFEDGDIVDQEGQEKAEDDNQRMPETVPGPPQERPCCYSDNVATNF